MRELICFRALRRKNHQSQQVILYANMSKGTSTKKGRILKVSSVPPEKSAPEIEPMRSTFSPQSLLRGRSELERWREISSRVNEILDKRLDWIPESKLLEGGGNCRSGDDRMEMARLKTTVPKFINRKSKVRLYNIKVKINGAVGRRGSVNS